MVSRRVVRRHVSYSWWKRNDIAEKVMHAQKEGKEAKLQITNG